MVIGWHVPYFLSQQVCQVFFAHLHIHCPLFPRVLDLFLSFCKSHNSNISKNDTIQDSSIDYSQYCPKHNYTIVYQNHMQLNLNEFLTTAVYDTCQLFFSVLVLGGDIHQFSTSLLISLALRQLCTNESMRCAEIASKLPDAEI